ncbi:MAG TPA: hypothetical protein VFL13_01605 [Candidatus Baltobacteraceae bacterium]|nr:hypothetical protein [Candidatus Baltobacteraceae bacterium]
MQIKALRVLPAVIAAGTFASCAQKPEAAATPPPAALSAAYKHQVAAVGHRLEAQDRRQDAEKREEMARIVGVRVLRAKDGERTFSFLVEVRNKTSKAIKALSEGLEVHDAAGKRIGLLEIDDAPLAVPAHATVQRWQDERYVRFGDETAGMVEAAGKPKTAAITVIDVTYADGTQAGGDGD